MLLMLMRDTLGPKYSRFDAGILATDISERILNTAKKGVYGTDRISALPENKQKRYFTRVGKDQYKVVDALREEAVLRRFNLMNKVFPFKKQFQVIFCRNVMIYFDQKTREQLVGRFAQSLIQGGYLFIGHSESLGRDHVLFDNIMPAVYRKKV